MGKSIKCTIVHSFATRAHLLFSYYLSAFIFTVPVVIMSWFGGGKKEAEKPVVVEDAFPSSDPFDSNSDDNIGSSSSSSFGSSAPLSTISPGGGAMAGGGTEAFQRAIQVNKKPFYALISRRSDDLVFFQAEQQKILIQAVMFKLTDLSFDSCVSQPGTALSSSERNCIAAVTSKYLESADLIGSKLAKQK